jgi:type 2 lantibiotic biosynthesis protein LanM
VTSLSADVLPHPSFAEEVARGYFPDPRQWAAVRPVVTQLDVASIGRGRQPAAWTPRPLLPAVEEAVAQAAQRTPFARSTALLFAGDLGEVARALSDPTASAPVAPDAAVDVLTTAVEWLSAQLLRIQVTDLHARRAAGTLAGETSEDRFAAYLADAESDDALRSVAERFPQLVDTGARRLRGLAEQARRLQAALAQAPSELAPPGSRIARLAFGAGDTHAGGLSTAVVTWDDGSRVVFKPRDLAVEAAFFDLYAELLGRDGVDFRAPLVHQTPHGGLVEFVPTHLPSDEQAPRYYENLGRLAALTYLLGGRDIHFENVVASGTVPVPIDLECLLQGETLEQAVLAPSATLQVTRSIADSVLASMVLPTSLESGGEVFRLGASGMVGEQQSPLRTFAVEGAGRDDMRIVLRSAPMTFDLTVPEIDPERIDPYDLMDWVGAGVRSLLETVRADAEQLARTVDAAFRGVTVRYLNAPSMAYGQLLRMLTHPSLAARADLSAYAASRAATFAEVRSSALLQAECEQLLDGDVPLFVFHPESTVVRSCGSTRAEVFARPPLDDALARIRSLDADVVEEQVQVARLSFVSQLGTEAEPTRFALDLDAAEPDPEATLALARRIGDDLLATVVGPVADDDVPNWRDIRISATGEGLWTPGPADQFVYGGFTGTARFLWHLGRVTGEPAYADLARTVLVRLGGQVLTDPASTTDFGLGATCGMAGIAEVMLEVAAADRDATLTEAGLLVLRRCLDRVETAQGPADFMSGPGGLLAVATSLRDRGLADDTLLHDTLLHDIATACLARLARLAADGDELFSFTGFAHGVSGVRPYVAAWPDLPGHDQVAERLTTTLDTLAIGPGEGWHTSTSHSGRAYGWCHGSPGILLGSVLTARHADESPALTQEALALTEAECFGRGVSLCHGDLGNVEILHTAHELLGTGEAPRVAAAWDALLHQVDARLRSPRPPRAAFTQSLLVGRVGVGYQALRRLAPGEVPSTLH